jgi:hypothetical protein
MIEAQTRVAPSPSTGYWLLATGYWLPTTGYRLPALEMDMQGMGKVWARYGPVSKSFVIKYGGMAYGGEGGYVPESQHPLATGHGPRSTTHGSRCTRPANSVGTGAPGLTTNHYPLTTAFTPPHAVL